MKIIIPFLALLAVALSGCSVIGTQTIVGRRLTQPEVQVLTGNWESVEQTPDHFRVSAKPDGTLVCYSLNRSNKWSSEIVLTVLPDHEDIRIGWLDIPETKEDPKWAIGRLIWNEKDPDSLGFYLPNIRFINELEESGELEVSNPNHDTLIGEKNLDRYLLDNRFWDIDNPRILVRSAPMVPRKHQKR